MLKYLRQILQLHTYAPQQFDDEETITSERLHVNRGAEKRLAHLHFNLEVLES